VFAAINLVGGPILMSSGDQAFRGLGAGLLALGLFGAASAAGAAMQPLAETAPLPPPRALLGPRFQLEPPSILSLDLRLTGALADVPGPTRARARLLALTSEWR
jgi:hypothetical protein